MCLFLSVPGVSVKDDISMHAIFLLGHKALPYIDYRSFRTIRCTPPQIWEENLDVSCSLNVVYLACWVGGGQQWSGFFSPYFPPLKPRYVLWSGVSYSPKNSVFQYIFIEQFAVGQSLLVRKRKRTEL